jgi:hypothetical protein
MAAAASSVFAAPAARAQAEGSLSGTASSPAGKPLTNHTVQLRNTATGKLAGTTTSNGVGQFSFAGLNPGSFAVEVLNAAGEIVGTSASISVAAGAVVTGVAVSASAAAATAGAAAAAVAGGSFFASTAGIITVIAAGAAVAGVTVAATTASPSK